MELFAPHNIEFSTRPVSERHYRDLHRQRVFPKEFTPEYCNDLLGRVCALLSPVHRFGLTTEGEEPFLAQDPLFWGSKVKISLLSVGQ